MCPKRQSDLPKGIYIRGGSTYWIRYTDITGKQRFETSGSARLDVAERLLRKRLRERDEGRMPELNQANPTLKDIQDAYLAEPGRQLQGGLEATTQRLKLAVEIIGPNLRIRALKDAHIRGMVQTLSNRVTQMGTPIATSTINKYVTILKAAIKSQVNLSEDSNPFKTIKKQIEPPERDRIFTRDEYELIVNNAYPDLKVAFILAYHSGMRLGEIVQITESMIDYTSKFIRLSASITKTSKARQVPMNNSMMKAIKEHGFKDDGRLIYSEDVRVLSRSFRRLCESNVINDCKFHDTRHTAATRMIKSGVNVFTVMEIMGLQSVQMIKRYTKIADSDLQDAINKIDG